MTTGAFDTGKFGGYLRDTTHRNPAATCFDSYSAALACPAFAGGFPAGQTTFGYHARVPQSEPLPLFPSLLGSAFEQLPPVVRALHLRGTTTYSGEVAVRRGRGGLSRLCCWVARLPPAYAGTIGVGIFADAHGEVWTRRFGAHVMRSSLSRDRGRLHERLGPLRFWFRLAVTNGRLVWTVERVRFLLIPLPITWFRGIAAVEGADAGRYTFDVTASLPVVGLLVHYRGWLDVG